MLTLCTGAAPSSNGGEEFRKFLGEITQGDAGLSEFLKVSLGACLSGAIENHWMLFWIGNGRNGKNTLGDLVQDAMGDYAKKVPASTLMAKSFESHPTEIANLQGVRLATSSEVNDNAHWDEARINEITGDARLTGRFMRCDHIEFERTHKHLIYGNYKPQLRSVSDGIRSRIRVVPFNASFKGREDADLPSRLRENLGYVLSWLIEGHRQWIANNKHLPICATVEAESAQYFEGQTTPQLWLNERCDSLTLDDRPTEHLPKVNDLYRDYKAWKETRGEKAVSQARWAEAAMRKFEKVRSNRGQHYRGLRLLPQTDGFPFTGVPYPPPVNQRLQ
jgi:putative DNA primase/helicase